MALAVFEKSILWVNEFLWGSVLLPLLVWCGLLLSVRTGFVQIRKFVFFNKMTIGTLFKKKKKKEGGITPFAAASTALAGTIGTGSVTGIATAIVLGGPGSVFWMWVSALLGMVTKYSEIVLSMKYRENGKNGERVGGPMYYIEKAMGKRNLARFFAFFTLIACFGIGNMAQSNAISAAAESALCVSPWISAAVTGCVMSIVIIGGMRRIGAVNERLVPVMASFYILCAVGAIMVNFKKVPEAFCLIFSRAFDFRALGGAGIGEAMRYGFSRGIFSNEAGLGSAPIAHASSVNENEVEQGFWGMFEVFFTTVIICTLTALVIIIAGIWERETVSGTALAIKSFDAMLAGSGRTVVTTASVLFALSSILGWAYYGEVSISYLFPHNKRITDLYRVVYVALSFLGAVGSVDIIWQISEVMNGLMALPNLIALIAMSGIIGKMTKEYFSEKEETYVKKKRGGEK